VRAIEVARAGQAGGDAARAELDADDFTPGIERNRRQVDPFAATRIQNQALERRVAERPPHHVQVVRHRLVDRLRDLFLRAPHVAETDSGGGEIVGYESRDTGVHGHRAAARLTSQLVVGRLQRAAALRTSQHAEQGGVQTGRYTTAMFRPIAGVLILAIVATVQPRRVRAQPASSSTPPITSPALLIELPAATERDRQRVHSAARAALDRLTEWFGRCPATSIALVNRPWRGAVSTSPSNVVLDVPWRSAPETMDLESQAVFGVARQWWPGLLANSDTGTVADGLAWYLQSRIVDRLFDLNFLLPAHSVMAVRHLGGAWAWTFPILPLGKWTGGLGRDEYLRSRRNRSAWPVPGRRLPPSMTSSGLRSAIAFATLEQLVGWPSLQGALRVLSEASVKRSMTRRDVEQVIASAIGRDLSWFFRMAFDESAGVDYAIGELTTVEGSPCDGGPCFRTRVTAVRNGTGEFTGSSEDDSTSFETGDAVDVRVGFADGQHVRARWDGRAPSRTFEFESASPAVSAVVDPDRILLLDEDALNNAMVKNASTRVAIRKWVAYWMVWLEGAALDYGALF
jgi:hypothetical protein